jgi:hypothetical protein
LAIFFLFPGKEFLPRSFKIQLFVCLLSSPAPIPCVIITEPGLFKAAVGENMYTVQYIYGREYMRRSRYPDIIVAAYT